MVGHPRPIIRGDGGVRVRTLEVGVCGTDREICSFVYGEAPKGYDYLILGHESLGEVVEVGADVRNLKVGDLVVPSVRRPCLREECRPCRNGYQDFCSSGEFIERGIKGEHGYMAEEYIEQEDYLYLAPQHLRDVAVLVEPLTIAEKAMAQLWLTRKRFPWEQDDGARPRGAGMKAVVIGTGPIGILGAMKLLSEGFETYVYSRSPKPNYKSELVESLGAEYFSMKQVTLEEFAERVGQIDLVYEAAGVFKSAWDILSVMGENGIFIFTGIPALGDLVSIEANRLMRNLVLKNQLIYGTVNADEFGFREALTDLGKFQQIWPEALRRIVTGRYDAASYRELLLEPSKGIKNVIRFA